MTLLRRMDYQPKKEIKFNVPEVILSLQISVVIPVNNNIDHYPYFGICGAEDKQSLQVLITQTIRLYELYFGPYPKQSTDTAKDACQEMTA